MSDNTSNLAVGSSADKAAEPEGTLIIKATDKPIVEPTETKALEVETIEYDATGDTGLDVALEFVGRLGIGPEHPAMAAASNGDFGPLEAYLGTLGAKAKGFERMVTLGRKAFEDGKAKAESKVKADTESETKTKEAIYAAMGGADNWAAIQAWASANATDAEKEDVTKAFRSGGMIAVAMAERLTNLYRKAGGTFKGKGAVKADAAGSQAGTGAGTLSPRQFVDEVAKARAAHRGGNWDESKTYADLRARRQAWKG
jgi:hypothetical protein